jgi:hypothetical protein
MIDVWSNLGELGAGAAVGLGVFVGFTRASLREIRLSLSRIERHNETQNGRLAKLEVHCAKTNAILPVLEAAVLGPVINPGIKPSALLRGGS